MLAEIPLAIASKRNSPALGPGFRFVAQAAASARLLHPAESGSRGRVHRLLAPPAKTLPPASGAASRSRSRRRPRPGLGIGRLAAAPEPAATRRPLREATRQPLIEDRDVRPRDLHACARPRPCLLEIDSPANGDDCGRTSALGGEDGLDGTIGFDGKQSSRADPAGDRFPRPAAARRAIGLATKRKCATTRC